MSGFHPADAVLRDLPPEWDSIPDDLLVRLAPAGVGAMTPEQRVAMNQLARSQWFLVRNELGARCGNCASSPLGNPNRLPGAVHTYLTYKCQPLPFNGLRSVMLWLGGYPRDVREALLAMSKPGNAQVPGTFVPIRKRDALRLNKAIRDAGGRTVDDQLPPREVEFDPQKMSAMIRRRANAPYDPRDWR